MGAIISMEMQKPFPGRLVGASLWNAHNLFILCGCHVVVIRDNVFEVCSNNHLAKHHYCFAHFERQI